MKKTLTLLTILALGLTACNKVELQDTPEQTPGTLAEAPVFHFNLPASFDGNAATKAVNIGEKTARTTFAETDNVYVVIEHDGVLAIAYDPAERKCISMTVTPDANPWKATLSGALKFYYDDGDHNPIALTPAEGDAVYLFYNMRLPDLNPAYLNFNYLYQTGSKDQKVSSYWDYYYGATYHDYGEAKMKIAALDGDDSEGYTMSLVQFDDPDKSDVTFQNVGSLFRQELTFKDKNGDPVTPTLTQFVVTTAENNTIYMYCPLASTEEDRYIRGPVVMEPIDMSDDGNIYFAMMFVDDIRNETLYITAEDEDGNVYTASKAAPAGGFENGKYYYGKMELTWLKCKQPTATYEDYLGKWANGTRIYTIESKVDGESYSISGLNGQGDYEVEAKFEDQRLVLYEQIVAQDGDRTVALQSSGNNYPGYPDGTPVVIFSALYDKGNNQLSITHESYNPYIDFFTYEGQTMTDDVYEEIPVSLIPYVPDTATYLYYEDFEGDNSSSWTFIDADGDGNLWSRESTLHTYSGGYALTSASYDTRTYNILYPDNWAFTPPVTLTSNNYLSFWVRAQDPNYPAEHYAVYITDDAPTAANLGDCTVLLAEQEYPNGNYVALAGDGYYQRYVIQIPSSFDGKTVYIGFRHFNCSDQFQLTLDDVAVAQGNPVTD